MFRIFLLAVLISGAVGQLAMNRPCDIVVGMPVQFNMFAGTWYQIERIQNSEEIGDCSTSEYNANMTFVNREVANRNERLRTGVITTNAADITGPWNVTFNDGRSLNYHLLVTDYQNYGLLYSCENTDASNSNVWAWKLSRMNTMGSVGNLAINVILNAHPHLLNATWRPTVHNNNACQTDGAASLQAMPIMALAALYLIFYTSKEYLS